MLLQPLLLPFAKNNINLKKQIGRFSCFCWFEGGETLAVVILMNWSIKMVENEEATQFEVRRCSFTRLFEVCEWTTFQFIWTVYELVDKREKDNVGSWRKQSYFRFVWGGGGREYRTSRRLRSGFVSTCHACSIL